MKQTLVALVQDRPGALNRVVSLFRRRGFNIDSIAIGPSELSGISRMTMVVNGGAVEQVVKQLNRLIDVLRVRDVSAESVLERETALVRIHAAPAARVEITTLCGTLGARVLDVGARSMVLELTDTPAALDRFIDIVRPYGLQELTRTGRIAMVRPERTARAGGGRTARAARPKSAKEPAGVVAGEPTAL